MSAINNIVMEQEEVQVKVGVKKVNFPEKFMKHKTFSYWLIKLLIEKNIISSESQANDIYDVLHFTDTTEVQNTFYEGFETNYKVIGTDMKEFIKPQPIQCHNI